MCVVCDTQDWMIFVCGGLVLLLMDAVVVAARQAAPLCFSFWTRSTMFNEKKAHKQSARALLMFFKQVFGAVR